MVIFPKKTMDLARLPLTVNKLTVKCKEKNMNSFGVELPDAGFRHFKVDWGDEVTMRISK